jgi:hypothetical protein
LKFILQFLFQLDIGIREQITGNYACRAQILLEKISIDNLHSVPDSQDSNDDLTPKITQGIDLKTHSSGPKTDCCSDDYAAIPTAQVINQVIFTDFGHGQHGIYL